MKIASGVTDQVIYFVALDATDLKTRETGLASFTVYRSRNGSSATAFTTPTVTEVDSTNMPGVYKLLLDEDMTIDSGDETQEMVFHISHAGMAPVTRVIELYRPKITVGETATVASGIASANVKQWNDTNVPTPDTAGYPKTTIKSGTGTGELLLSSGLVSVNDPVVISGSVNDAGATTTDFDGDGGLSSTDDFYNGSVLVFTGGTLKGIARKITDYVGSSRNLQFTSPFPTAPANSDTFLILGRID